jgi:negative regulator of sigma-B (phosphoserine phosphatase)
VGHGPEAAVVSRQATALLSAAEREHPLTVVRLCHEGLRTSRGVVMSLAWFDPTAAIMTWLGVGNVAGLLVRGDRGAAPRQELLLLRNGVVGRQLPPLQANVLAVSPGDTLVLATDGVDPDFMTRTVELGEPETTAARILEAHATGLDDALVLVARYRGAPS